MLLGVEQEDSLIIRKILLTHDPDGRCVDSRMLLQMIENVMCYATTASCPVSQTLAETLLGSSNRVAGTHKDLWKTIHDVSCEVQLLDDVKILCEWSGQEDLHARTMSLFELLRNFTWDAKMVVALSAFATSYGEFCLLIQLYPMNPLAVSIAMLKQFPTNLEMFNPRFKALSSLVTAMVDVTKCIIEFETLPTQQIKLDHKEISDTKSQIYAATYWVLRSTLTCSSLITDLIAINDQQVKLDSNTTSATWELSSLVYKVTRICRKLRKQVDKCHLQIENKLHRKLLDLFEKETHLDNQKVLSTLFSLKDDKPLKDCCSQEKIGVPDLLNKVVVLLISKPEILPLEELLYLVQQTCSNFPCDDRTMRRYEIVWVPIPSSITWTDEENKVFKHLSDILPWYSIRQPSRVNSAVVNYLKHVSGFVGEPVMVVVDQNGRLANLNAIHMVHIWGPSAYPFTASREEKLWEEVNWFGQLIADEIDPLLSKQVEEGRICLFGSSDINWIRELSTRIKEMTKTGLQLDLIYVGKKRRLNDDQHVSNIISTITQEKLSSYLAYPKMHFFWLRMENIKRSEIKLGKKATKAEHILKNVGSLVNFDDCEKSWALFGERFSKDILQLQGRKLMECLRLFQVWGENIEKVGFMAAIRCALEPPMASLEPCYICNVSEFIQGNQKEEGIVLCEECKRPMKMFSVYQCNAVE